jgi:short-subunit dehydrogenase
VSQPISASPSGTRDAGGPRRNALVTGASAGIGRAFAERLARDQYDLVLVARGADRLEELAKRLSAERGIEVRALPADLVEPADLARVEAELRERTPDLLVNNAGFGTVGRFAELDVAGEERELRLNALALMRLTHAAVGPMVDRRSGCIINVSSLAGESPAPYSATYAATKAFVTSLTEALSEELRGSGVRVQALLPGFTHTEFQDRAGIDKSAIPSFAWMDAETVVDLSLAGLERGQVVCVPGLGNRILAPFQRIMPRALVRRVVGASFGRALR